MTVVPKGKGAVVTLDEDEARRLVDVLEHDYAWCFNRENGMRLNLFDALTGVLCESRRVGREKRADEKRYAQRKAVRAAEDATLKRGEWRDLADALVKPRG